MFKWSREIIKIAIPVVFSIFLTVLIFKGEEFYISSFIKGEKVEIEEVFDEIIEEFEMGINEISLVEKAFDENLESGIEYLKGFEIQNEFISAIYYGTKKDEFYSSPSFELPPDYKASERSWYKGAYKNNKLKYSSAYYSRDSEQTLSITKSYGYVSNPNRGVLGADIRFYEFVEKVFKKRIEKGKKVMVIEKDSRKVISKFNYERDYSSDFGTLIFDLLEGNSIKVTKINNEGVDNIYLYRDIPYFNLAYIEQIETGYESKIISKKIELISSITLLLIVYLIIIWKRLDEKYKITKAKGQIQG